YFELYRISPLSHLIAVLLGKTDGHRRFFSTKDINDEYCKTLQSLFFTDEDEMEA
ncbi:SH3 domain containing kinase-binding protein 1, partial [Dissostichus eleginoides]